MLQPGDILAFKVGPEAPLLDRLIGWGERMLKQSNSDKKNYYHIAFVSHDPTHMYSAEPPRIGLLPIPSPIPNYIEVYRLINPPTADQLKQVFTYADSQLGNLYNFLGVLTGGYVQVGKFQFCSQFTWIAYNQGGIDLCPYEFLESPDDIANSKVLVQVDS
jgi:uncharacterized protein YycO